MKVIGLFGLPGAGKTEASKYLLNKYENIHYINVDDLTTSIAELNEQRKIILESVYNGKYSLYKRRHNFNKKLSDALVEEVDKIKSKSKCDYILIDYVRLNELKSLLPLIDIKVLITRTNKKRENGIKEREGASGGKHIERVLKIFVKNFCQDLNKIKTDYKIKNESTLEDLYKNIETVFNFINGMN